MASNESELEEHQEFLHAKIPGDSTNKENVKKIGAIIPYERCPLSGVKAPH